MMTTNEQNKCAHLRAGAWCNLATNTAVKPVRKREPVKSRSLASVIMESVPLPYENVRSASWKLPRENLEMKSRRTIASIVLLLAVPALSVACRSAIAGRFARILGRALQVQPRSYQT